MQTFESISDGAKVLLNSKKRWCSQSFTEHRRAELIQEKVFRYKVPQLELMSKLPDHDWGFWSLVEKNKMLIVDSIDSPFPLGEMRFKETEEPPSRAYLKLWEVLTRFSIDLNKDLHVVDLGACPGGWTWVLAQNGCRVQSVDKAPLDEKILNLQNVQYLKKDAFKIGIEELGGVPDWIFSDVICYPQELYHLVLKWMDMGVQNFVCTLKFKGETDWKAIEDFQKIPNSELLHLCANKHELTFIKIK